MRQKEEKKERRKVRTWQQGKNEVRLLSIFLKPAEGKSTKKTATRWWSTTFCWLVFFLFFLSVPHLLLVGVHNWCVLQTKLEGWKIKVQRPHGCATSQQPDGQQDLDPRYFLPQWQKVSGAQHDHAKQASANYRGRHTTLYHEVGQCILPHWCNKDFKRN